MGASEDLTAGVRDWFARWGRCVASRDFEGARALFDPAVSGFGTFKDRVHGLDALEAGQWRSVWPAIEDFRFDLDALEVLASGDGRMAVGIVTWDSTGVDEAGARFPRPGRATVVLARAGDRGEWRGLHTHFSVFPAGRRTTFGDRER